MRPVFLFLLSIMISVGNAQGQRIEQQDGKSVDEIKKEILAVEEAGNQAMLKHGTREREADCDDSNCSVDDVGCGLSRHQRCAG